MIKIEDLPKYVGKEVFVIGSKTKEFAEGYYWSFSKPIKVKIKNISLALDEDGEIKEEINVCGLNYEIFPNLHCSDLYATKEECEETSKKKLEDDIDRAKSIIKALEKELI